MERSGGEISRRSGAPAAISAPATVIILMATFNGERYLGPQLDSIRRQSFDDWRLLARDDGSSDGTLALLRQAAAADPRIQIVEDGRGSLGPGANFSALMESAAARDEPYCMFADQDDVWRPDKIQRLLAAMAEVESKHGADQPALVHSDLEVVDAELRQIAPSYFRCRRIRHVEDSPLAVLLCQNFVTGCATLFNRPLLRLATPGAGPMHDWWVALLAAAAGHMAYVHEPTVCYRQHRQNAIGCRSLWREMNPLDGGLRQRLRRSAQVFRAGPEQARQAALRLRERKVAAEENTLAILETYGGLFSLGAPARLWRAVRNHIGPQGLARRLVYLSRLLLVSGR